MAQVLRKEYQCFGCGVNILISKIDNPTGRKKWESWETDGVTPHVSNNKKQEQQRKEEEVEVIQEGETRFVQLPESRFTEYVDAIKALTKQIETLNVQIAKLQAANLVNGVGRTTRK